MANAKSLGKECAAFLCNERSYFVNGEGVLEPTHNVFFKFPSDNGRKNDWCNLIRTRDGFDGFKVTKYTVLCSKHFKPCDKKRPPGGTRTDLIKGARPLLHSWNNWSVNVNERKPPKERITRSPPVVKKALLR